jgi:hypothetical protein
VFEFDLGMALKVACTKCGAARELPEPDGVGSLPAASPDGSTTLQADSPCQCGGDRVRVRLDFGDSEETPAAGEKAKRKVGR